MDEPAPARTAAELRLFDPQGGLFRRVKVAGQVMHANGPELFVADRGTGLRSCPYRPR